MVGIESFSISFSTTEGLKKVNKTTNEETIIKKVALVRLLRYCL